MYAALLLPFFLVLLRDAANALETPSALAPNAAPTTDAPVFVLTPVEDVRGVAAGAAEETVKETPSETRTREPRDLDPSPSPAPPRA